LYFALKCDWVIVFPLVLYIYVLCGSVVEYIIQYKYVTVLSRLLAAGTILGNGLGGSDDRRTSLQ